MGLLPKRSDHVGKKIDLLHNGHRVLEKEGFLVERVDTVIRYCPEFGSKAGFP